MRRYKIKGRFYLFLAILLILFVVNRIGAKQDEMKVY